MAVGDIARRAWQASHRLTRSSGGERRARSATRMACGPGDGGLQGEAAARPDRRPRLTPIRSLKKVTAPADARASGQRRGARFRRGSANSSRTVKHLQWALVVGLARRSRSEHQATDPRAPVSAHHDEVVATRLGETEILVARRADGGRAPTFTPSSLARNACVRRRRRRVRPVYRPRRAPPASPRRCCRRATSATGGLVPVHELDPPADGRRARRRPRRGAVGTRREIGRNQDPREPHVPPAASLRRAHRQHRTLRPSHDLLRDAPEHRVRDALTPVRAHHDQIRSDRARRARRSRAPGCRSRRGSAPRRRPARAAAGELLHLRARRRARQLLHVDRLRTRRRRDHDDRQRNQRRRLPDVQAARSTRRTSAPSSPPGRLPARAVGEVDRHQDLANASRRHQCLLRACLLRPDVAS